MPEADAIPAALQSALDERYALSRVLGRGGMAVVYLADDRKHRRDVAIKVLRPDLAATLGSDRFLKEIEIAARLSHPHILALYDSGEAEGFLYYVMPYVEGASLRQRLERERRLDLADALAIAGPVADALTYAHRMGVFHRDIKPENILFQQGHAIVGDFGIAKAIVTAGGMNLTRTGFPVGTPGYMSPEQAAGLTDLDERTDVYSLAVVVYEMLVGELPGRWPSEESVRHGRLLEAPPSHRARLAQVGGPVEGAIARALAIRHDQRTQSPALFFAQLTGVLPPVPLIASPPPPVADAPASVPRRRYAPGEALELVHRAADIEATMPTVDGAMTIGGVEAMAAEVGIKPEAVRKAARVSSPPPVVGPIGKANKRNILAGGPTSLFYERIIDGEVPVSEFPALVDEVRETIRNNGQVAQLGTSFTWTTVRAAEGGGRDVQVSVSVRQGRTRITVQEGLGSLLGGMMGGIVGGVGGGGLGFIIPMFIEALKAPQLVIVAIPAWVLTVYAATRSGYRYASARRARQLEALADRLAFVAQEMVPQAPRLEPTDRKLLP